MKCSFFTKFFRNILLINYIEYLLNKEEICINKEQL